MVNGLLTIGADSYKGVRFISCNKYAAFISCKFGCAGWEM